MELRQFTYVSKVAECGSITKAAAALFISQPALSNYIGKVEEELGVRLFDRSSSPLVLTYAGEQYLKRTKKILVQMDDMDREMRDITHHLRGRIRIGFPSEPGIEVVVVSGPGNRLVQQLRNGDVDFVMLPAWTRDKDIVQVEVSQEELVLVAGKGYLKKEHLLEEEGKVVNWRQVARLPLITLYKGHALRSCVEVLYQNAGLKPDIFMESHSNMLSYRLAAQGLGVAIVPEITLELMKGSMEAEAFHLAKIPVTWEVQALYREGCYMGEVEQALLEITREVLETHRKRL